MMIQVVFVCLLVCYVAGQQQLLLNRRAGIIEPARPYSYSYQVNDQVTGDAKTSSETSDGSGLVTGEYSVMQPDGVLRTVTYHADPINGFVANVDYQPSAAAPIDVPAISARRVPQIVATRPAFRTVAPMGYRRAAYNTLGYRNDYGRLGYMRGYSPYLSSRRFAGNNYYGY